MRTPYAEYRAKRGALLGLAGALLRDRGEASGRAERDAGYSRPAWIPNTKGRAKQKAFICPAKIYRRHPDKAVRDLAYAQAEEIHLLNDELGYGKKCRQDPTGPWQSDKVVQANQALREVA